MFSSSKNISNQLKELRISKWILITWLLISVFGPLFTHEAGNGFFPSIFPYDPSNIDLDNARAVGPFEEQNTDGLYTRHWLGTDEIGRDVLSQLIHGSRTAIIVGFCSVLIAGFIGILLGAIPAYLGDRSIRMESRSFRLALGYSMAYIIYFFFVFPWKHASLWMIIPFTIASSLLVLLWKRGIKTDHAGIYLPFDLIAGRLIEAMESLPILFIIISLSAVIKPSIWGIVLIIGVSNWATIARYARAETLKVKNMPYVESARAIGASKLEIIRHHILPNALGPVLVTMAFGVASAILIEATLSFLGIGIGVEEASWGSMMAEARKTPEAWWLAIFPGLAIFLVVYSCNKLGELFNKDHSGYSTRT